MPIIKAKDLLYGRLRSPDLDAEEEFLTHFGMYKVARTNNALYMRGTGSTPFLHVNEKGEPVTWSFEGGSPSQLVALGWSKDKPRIGEKVEVGFRPLRDGSHGGQLMSVKLPSGDRLCSNRGCGDGTGTVLGPL